jgi:hypothetical protein
MTKSELIGTEINRDFVLGAWTRFIGEVALGRDVIDGTTREDNLTDTVGTRGLAMYFFPLYYRATMLAIDQLGHVPRNAAEWGGVSIAGFEAAKASYLREQGGSGPGPVDPPPLNPPPVGPLPPTDLDRIDGQLQVEPGGGFVVNGRPVLPTLCHYGDAFSRWTHGGRDEVLGWLDVMASTGYHGIRFWSTLGPGSDFWAGREVYEGGTPNYWDQLREFLSALRDRGLVCQISQGDLRASVIPNRRAFAETMAQVVGEVGPHVVALFEGLNEAWQNGEPDPGRLAEFVGAFKARRPEVLVGLSTAQFEGQDEHNAWCIDPANVYIHHSFRGLHWNNKVEHIWSTPYEDRPRRRQGWQGEPAGPGDDVSASDHKEELDDDALCAMAVAALMTRQAWVYFSGPGVRSNRHERFDQMPGFHTVPKVRALLPPDVGRYQSIWHGGEGKPWSPLRVFGALPGTRCEHTYHDPDGRFVVLAYGEAPGRVPQLRPARIDRDISFGNKARLLVGQAS